MTVAVIFGLTDCGVRNNLQLPVPCFPQALKAVKPMRSDTAQLLKTIARLMGQRKNRTMGYKELREALNWDDDYAAFGSITDFAEKHPDWFLPKCGCMTLKWDVEVPEADPEVPKDKDRGVMQHSAGPFPCRWRARPQAPALQASASTCSLFSGSWGSVGFVLVITNPHKPTVDPRPNAMATISLDQQTETAPCLSFSL